MADKIKKFFQKKKLDAKFKLAGPGHRLSETSSVGSRSEGLRRAPVRSEADIGEESRLAAEAAQARLAQRKDNPAFNTSLAAIQAQVRKELEQEKDVLTATSSEPRVQRQTVKEVDLTKNLAVTGVYFKCPLISNDILPREEWKCKIKEFLYEQLETERGLTACLLIHSCNTNREKVEACVETLCKYLENIVGSPEEEKYRKIRMSNRVFEEKVQPIEGAMDLLMAAGFTQQTIDGLEYLVLSGEDVGGTLEALIDALRTAEPIQLELDRNLQVLLPSQAQANWQLPPSFYSITPEELKREQQLRAESIERAQMLRTKAMREKDELREMRRYRFALVRVRFPDGILLQGTFSVYERYAEIHEFVQENLEHSDVPFILSGPTGHKLLLDEDANKTLIDLRLVPTSVLIFAWHPSAAEQLGPRENKEAYLKPEVMILVREL